MPDLRRRALTLSVTTLAFLATALPVLGAEPAVTIPAPPTDAGPDDWTYRFLIPTLIALAVVVVIATTIQYFLQVVRKRYKVVE